MKEIQTIKGERPSSGTPNKSATNNTNNEPEVLPAAPLFASDSSSVDSNSGLHIIECSELEIIPGPSDAPTHTIMCKKLIIRFNPLGGKRVIKGQSELVIKSK